MLQRYYICQIITTKTVFRLLLPGKNIKIIRMKINWDALGITTSLACAIHCAVLPLLMTSLPLFGINIIHNHAFEYTMIALAFVIGARALYHGTKHHHQSKTPVILFSIGILLLVFKEVWHDCAVYFLIPAVFFIIYAHYLNYKKCKAVSHCSDTTCAHQH